MAINHSKFDANAEFQRQKNLKNKAQFEGLVPNLDYSVEITNPRSTTRTRVSALIGEGSTPNLRRSTYNQQSFDALRRAAKAAQDRENRKVERLTAELDKNQVSAQELAYARSEVSKRSKTIAKQETEISELNSKTVDQEKTNKELTAKTETQATTITDLTAKAAVQATENADLKAKNTTLETENTDLKKRVSTQESETKDLRAKNEELKRKNEDLAKTIDSLRGSNKSDPLGYFKVLESDANLLVKIYQRIGIDRAFTYLKKQYHHVCFQAHTDRFYTTPDPEIIKITEQKFKDIGNAFEKINTTDKLSKYLDLIINGSQ